MLTKTRYRLFFLFVISVSFFNANAQQPIPDWVKDIGNGESKLTGIAVDQFENGSITILN